MRTSSALPSFPTIPVIVLLTLLGAGCDKQNIGSNAESATGSGDPATGTTDDTPDCGENFCPGYDCISRCEDDDSVDDCWYRCEPGEEVDCWRSCANDDDDDDGSEVPPFDPGPDVGDGSLEENLMMVSEFGGQRLFISMTVERLGDSFQGEAQSALPGGLNWSFGPAQPINTVSAVVDNELTFRIDDYPFAAGHHPFGPGPKVLDIVVEARFHSEEILCGSISVDGDGVEASSPVTLEPFTWLDETGGVLLLCP